MRSELTSQGAGTPANKNSGQRCLVLHPHPKSTGRGSRSATARLDEAVGLAQAIELDVVAAQAVAIARPRPSTLFGGGVVDSLVDLIKGEDDEPPIDVVVVDGRLTPVQQRNLERAWSTKVIDRTGLILEIFGARARTREGRLQVELAALTYARSRLVRSWTHLERQRGGLGFVGGPGETQIETDRRLISERIDRLRRDLKDVKRTRGLHRQARRRVPYPIVALVGYTNAGKSTLFNTLTRAEVMAEDQLFATLDPTMRGLDLPSGRSVILSDTVGFVSDLPHELVDAFHATLEEVCEADIVVHVRDVAHPDTEQQKADVLEVLRSLDLDETVDNDLIEVANKVDLLAAEDREVLVNQAGRSNGRVIPLSALTGAGTADLLAAFDARLARAATTVEVLLAYEDGATLAWLYDHGEVMARQDDDAGMHLTVRLDPANAARFEQRHGGGSPS
ncbi:MAG: GTPase HflX [Rhodobacterales bacterium]|nr:GTPase HflX [Rhodobacterales bacterium]